ncbi:Putative acyl-CoA synthetase yngI [Verticillium dahliae VDG2]|nr:Putative acyl-CoA synthetase yngI [Verticillium dahliae VDG2]
MKKTLILCFIHGFKGGDDTFGEGYEFTEHLRSLVEQALPKLNVQVLVYPKYETRGDLGNCVSRFRDWLQEKVIDIEVEAGTSSPTVDPSVRTILIGHSMGGIVAAETVIGLTSDKPIYSEDGVEKSAQTPTSFNSLMFPYVQGVLAFDTPYLGISPGVGWTWATSHLEFVGCLAKGGELQKRVQYMTKVHQELDVGFANLYTRLGRGAAAKDVSVVGTVLGKDRTFCNLPKRGDAGVWKPAVNDKAEEETQAHMAMFERKNNPGYEALARDATDLIATWTRNAWYESSVEDAPALKQSAEDGSSRREDGSSRQGERRPAEEKVLGQEENPWA